MEIKLVKTTTPKQKPADEASLGFGKFFTDHMFIAEYSVGKGWHDARIVPYGPLSIDPASPVLHYGQEIFEGLKAYRRKDGGIQLFRPMENALRMNRSAERICMPPLDPEFQVKAMKMLIQLEEDWIPSSEGTSLYLRPMMIADGAELGVHPAKHFLYVIICSPSGAYYKNGMQPLRIHIEDYYVRAVKGGIGSAKTGGNYAASLKATFDAAEKGFDQVLWLDGRENKYVEEVGAMNMMFVIDGKIVTAPLEGSILAGITRKSILRLAQDKGYQTEERRISVQELFDAYERGGLTEAFGTGTAAVISPVGEMEYRGKSMVLNDRKIGKVSQEMYDTLVGIQRGDLPDTYGWTVEL
ncbi:MAG: branched chain amino acid aminotransferase [Clostridia bacterium]|nr:MAG: branched chain amino acid aminotransferase [Clostridia bacterium]